MGLVDDLNWKKEWAQANLEAELWDHLVSLPPEARKDSITAERLAPQITAMHDHLQLDIKRVLYRMHGKPLFEYRFYAIAKAFDYAIEEVTVETGYPTGHSENGPVPDNPDRPPLRLVKPDDKV